jgi:hypothetical protein
MQKIGAVFGIFVCSLVASGCDNSSAPQKVAEASKPTANQKVGKVLPFSVCDLSKNTAFQNGLSMIRADIRVDGGHSDDWVATGLAVAKQLGALGASTDVQVYVYRNDLGELEKATINGYRWLARIDYGATPQHSLNTIDGGKPWLITYATDDSVVTPRDIQIERNYQELMEKYNQPDIDDNVVAMIKKKYNIKGDWHIPSMNLEKSTNNPDDYFIDKNKQDEKLNDLGPLLEKGAGNFECSV